MVLHNIDPERFHLILPATLLVGSRQRRRKCALWEKKKRDCGQARGPIGGRPIRAIPVAPLDFVIAGAQFSFCCFSPLHSSTERTE